MKIFNIESEPKLSPCRRNLFAFTALFIIILSTYSNTFTASWHFDDAPNIVDRKAVQLVQFTWPEIKKTLLGEKGIKEGKFYRPVANFSFALNYYFGKTNVVGYHLVNICIHIVAAIFLFLFIYYTLNLPLLASRYGSCSYLIALLATVFWAINPVQTQAVTYIVQRMASMAAMFYIMAMYFYLRGRISRDRLQKGFYLLMCLFSGIFSVGSKENAAMLPISIFIFDFFLIQGVRKDNIKKNAFVFFILAAVPLLLALIMSGPSVFNPKEAFRTYDSLRPFTMLERVLTEPRIFLFYVSLLFYPMPQRLSITHDIAISHSLFDPPTTILAILIVLATLTISFITARRWPLISYCIVFFFINHLIEGSVFALELVFEHRNYLPAMLLFIPLAILFAKGVKFYGDKRSMQGILIVSVILILVGFGHSTFMRNFVWHTDAALWADANNKAPELIRPHINLGVNYLSRGMQEKALSEFTLAVSSKLLNNTTDRSTAFYNIGRMYHKGGDLDRAFEYYKKSLAVNPGDGKTHNNLGLLFQEKGQQQKALQAFHKALVNEENNIKAWKNFSLSLLKGGHIEKAVQFLDVAVQKWPHDAALLGAAGYANRLTGSYGKAYAFFARALEIEPHDLKVHLYMAEIYFKRGMDDAAGKEIQKFTQKGGDSDILGYVKGTTEEADIHMIEPHKHRVMNGLADAYEKAACDLKKKAEYLNGRTSPIQKRLGEDGLLPHPPSEQGVMDISEDYPSTLSQGLKSMSNGK